LANRLFLKQAAAAGFFLRAAVAGCACFPGTPAMGGIHSWLGEKYSERRASRWESSAPSQAQLWP